MKYELLFSGIGGQGVITLGETLCDAAIKAGYNVTFVPFYGQEKRGGRTMCNIVISDGVESPIISEANIMLIFDERSLADYQDLMDPNGTLILNSSMIDVEPACKCASLRKVPFNEVAQELEGKSPGDEVTLTIFRPASSTNRRETTFEITVALMADNNETGTVTEIPASPQS